LSTVYFRITARGADAPVRAPLLERLLARAEPAVSIGDWRADALRQIAPEGGELPCIAALAASAIDVRAAWVAVATPVHLVAGMSAVSLAEDGILELERAQADELARDFNELFADADVRLVPARDGVLLWLFDAALRVDCTPPDEMLGEDIGRHLPSGPDGARVRRLMSEVEMWLFEHPVNAERRAESRPAVSGLWLWGGGPSSANGVSIAGWAAGDAALCAVLERESAYAGAARSGAGRAGGASSGAARSGVVAIQGLPGTAEWAQAEERWLRPVVADLRAHRLERIEISAGRLRRQVNARGLTRFWRRTRPWWEVLRDER
jgi:hypothetical protein